MIGEIIRNSSVLDAEFDRLRGDVLYMVLRRQGYPVENEETLAEARGRSLDDAAVRLRRKYLEPNPNTDSNGVSRWIWVPAIVIGALLLCVLVLLVTYHLFPEYGAVENFINQAASWLWGTGLAIPPWIWPHGAPSGIL